MTTESIIKALGIPKHGAYSKYAVKLAAILKFLHQVKKDTTGVTYAPAGKIMVGREVEINYSRTDRDGNYIQRVINEGTEFDGTLFTITTKTGEYKITIPTDTDVYNYVCFLLGIEMVAVNNEPIQAPDIVCTAAIVPVIKKAVKFLSTDTIRPAMMHVCIEAKAGFIRIISTDAHRLYASAPIPFTGNFTGQLLIDKQACKAIAGFKGKTDISFTVLSDGIHITNSTQKTKAGVCDKPYPQWASVIPDINKLNSMTVQKQVLTDAIKPILPFTNKVTNQIVFHLNGSVNIKGSDIDFDMGCSVDIPYLNKDFDTLDISFNGKLLLECIDSFGSHKRECYAENNPDTVTWHLSTPTKALVLTGNDTQETLLLMPLMIGL